LTVVQSAKDVADRTLRMKRGAIERDHRMLTIQMMRSNKPELLFPKLFNQTWQKSIVANWIDSLAREFAEMVAPLPALNCASGGMKTERDKTRAAKKNKIGTNYWGDSNLTNHTVSWVDRYFSYGFAAVKAEPDYTDNCPKLRLLDPRGLYYENDRYGTTLRTAQCWRETVDKVAAMFPELAPLIQTKADDFGNRTLCAPNETIEVVEYNDADRCVMFLPERQSLVLTTYPNATARCAVQVRERPGLFDEPHGQFDSIVWVQLARHRMALLGLEAGTKAVGAPIAVPRDVVEMAVGPDAIIQTERPQDIRRVGIEVPQSTFALQEILGQELRMGARYPEGRAGGIDASVITGRGVQALMGSFDTQISTAQQVLGGLLAVGTELCFEIDAVIWPTMQKRITGTISGESYDITYTPGKDIGDVYACEVTYGFAAGLSPNAAIVMLLQLRGDQLIDRATVRRNLPFAIDAEQMERNVDVEQTADALKQGLFGLLGGLGPMAAQGIDPRPYLRTAAEIIQGRRNGKDLADLFVDSFAPEVMAGGQPGEAPATPGPASPESPGGPLPGQDALSGLPAGTVPGQAGQPPGGAPDLQSLVAGLRSGRPVLDASVTRRIPA
jgi:hypothetical protein